MCMYDESTEFITCGVQCTNILFCRVFFCTLLSCLYFRQVLEVVASLKGTDKIDMAEQAYKNACTLFRWTL